MIDKNNITLSISSVPGDWSHITDRGYKISVDIDPDNKDYALLPVYFSDVFPDEFKTLENVFEDREDQPLGQFFIKNITKLSLKDKLNLLGFKTVVY